MAITNLTNTKWKLNDTISLELLTVGQIYYLNFKSNDKDYIGFQATGASLGYVYNNGELSADTAWTDEQWVNQAYCTIEITSGDDVTNSDLIAFLTANAVQITALSFTRTKAAIKIYEDLTQEEYDALTKEPHSFYLVNGVGIYKGTTLISAGANSSMDEIVEELNQAIAAKQDTLVSGTNIKTINGESILGEGNIEVAASDDGVDTAYVEDEVLYIDDNTSAGGDGSDLTEDDVNNIISSNESVVTLTNAVSNLQTNKQDKLTAGENITIAEDGTISATSGGSGGGSTVINKTINAENFTITFTEEEITQLKNNTGIVVNATVDTGTDGILTLPLSQLYTGINMEDYSQQVILYCNAVGLTYYIFTPTTDNPLIFEMNVTSNPFGDGSAIDTSKFATKDEVETKQNELVSGFNIKTIGKNSLLGSGDIPFKTIEGESIVNSSEDITFKKLNHNSLLGKGNIEIGIKFVPTLPTATSAEYNKHLLYLNDNKLKYISKDVLSDKENCELIGNLPVALSRAKCATVGDNIYIFSSDFARAYYKFNVPTETIEYRKINFGTTTTGALSNIKYGGQVMSIGNDIYIVSGIYSDKTSVFKMNVLTETLDELEYSIPVRIGDFKAEAIGTDIYVIGGVNQSSFKYTTNIYKIDTANATVELLNIALPVILRDEMCCTVGTDIYLLGGYNDTANSNSRAVYKFDTINQTITSVGTLSSYHIQGFALNIGTNIYAFGGESSSGYQSIIYKYDTTTNTWNFLYFNGTVGDKTYNSFINMYEGLIYVGGSKHNNEIYLFGGYKKQSNSYADADYIQKFEVDTYVYQFKTIATEE